MAVGNLEATQVGEIVVEKGVAAKEPTTVTRVFKHTVERCGGAKALTFKRDEQWVSYTWKEYFDLSMKFAKGLIRLGLQPHDCLNIIGENAPEWFMASMGTIASGAITAGIYPNTSADACRYTSKHCGAKVIVLQNRLQLDKYLQIAKDLPALTAIIMWEGEVPTDVKSPVPIYKLKEVFAMGENVDDSTLEARIDAQLPGHCCLLTYTSGTTGKPKAVMTSHDNVTWTAGVLAAYDPDTGTTRAELNSKGSGGRGLSLAPPSHISAQMLDIHYPMRLGSQIFFPGPDVLQGKLVDYLLEIHPTYLYGIPRLWGGLMQGLQAYAKAHSITIKEAASGLDQCKDCASSGDAIPSDIVNFFNDLGISIYEAYGQSESTGPQTGNSVGHWKIDSVGPTMDGTKMRIDPENGEILCKGRNIFMGYLKDEAETNEKLQDGWMHTGDVGKMDEDGYLWLTGRLKELIIPLHGINVAPMPIEGLLKIELPAISHAVVVGDHRPYLTFLCTLRATNEGELDNVALDVARKIESTATTVQEAMVCSKFQDYIRAGMERVNAAATTDANLMKGFAILPHDFSIVGGELTPTLKLKRNAISKLYENEIEAMYAQHP